MDQLISHISNLNKLYKDPSTPHQQNPGLKKRMQQLILIPNYSILSIPN